MFGVLLTRGPQASEGARARGLQAVHVKSGADLADALAVLIERSRGS
jgi:hypothetical protein